MCGWLSLPSDSYDRKGHTGTGPTDGVSIGQQVGRSPAAANQQPFAAVFNGVITLLCGLCAIGYFLSDCSVPTEIGWRRREGRILTN